MGKNSAIEWTDHTWNPFQGCHKVSPGCKNCYMFRDKKRYGQDPNTVVRSSPATFNKPLTWKDPAKVFTCSWSDFFIEEADEWRDEAMEIIRKTPHLTYQILTKRPERIPYALEFPPNVWLGVSAENQDTYETRSDLLIWAEADIRWISAEPLLGPITLKNWLPDWVVIGGESDYKTPRAMKIEWAIQLIEQCEAENIPVFLKQLGGRKKINGTWGGNSINGKTWQQFPEPR